MPFNNDPNTMTPGSAVADQLQQILTQKRVEARQAMLDDINRQNIQSEMAARQEQADTNRAYRQMYGEERQAIAAKRNQETQDLADRKAEHQQQLQALRNYQYPADIDPRVKNQIDFMKKTNDIEGFKTVLSTLGQKPDVKGGDLFVIKPNGEVVDTGNWDPTGPKYEKLSYPPSGGEGPAPMQAEVTDEKGIKHLVLIDRSGKVTTVQMPNGLNYGGKPETFGHEGARPPRVPEATWTKLMGAKQAWIKSVGSNGFPDPQKDAMLLTAGGELLGYSDVSPMVKTKLQELMNAPVQFRKTYTPDKVRDKIIEYGGTPKDGQDAYAFWSSLTTGS